MTSALRTTLTASPANKHDVAAFYKARDYRPLWIERGGLRAEAHEFASLLARSDRDGLDAAQFDPGALALALDQAETGDAAALARAELRLSRTFADYVLALHRPVAAAGMIYTDRKLAQPPRTAQAVLEAAARAPSLGRHLTAVQRMNPLYDELRQTLADYRARWSALPPVAIPQGATLAAGARGKRVAVLRERLGLPPSPARFDAALAMAVSDFQSAHGLTPNGRADAATLAALNKGPAHYERLIRANLERARALPADGRRFVLVDTASATLSVYEDGQVRDSMRVVVGKPGQETPVMAGMIRFAVLNPYWNLPYDLAQERARRVLAQGVGYLAKDHLEALSGWEDDARVLSPEEVDWEAVAEGRQKLRMRQTPGPHNVMGDIKFMLPNHLGVYLHDTGDRSVFALAERRLSSGCVRVADAPRLARWLFDGKPPVSDGTPEQRVDLPEPVPVYITYMTVEPGVGGPVFRPDPYRRDPELVAQLDSQVLSQTVSAGRSASWPGSMIAVADR